MFFYGACALYITSIVDNCMKQQYFKWENLFQLCSIQLSFWKYCLSDEIIALRTKLAGPRPFMIV